MAGSGQIRAGRAYVEMGTDNNPLNRGLAKAQATLRNFGNVISGVGARFAALGASVVAPLTAMAKASAESGAAIYDMSKRTGITVENLSTLGFAAKLSGTDMETLEGAVRKMQKTIAGVEDVAEGTTGSLNHLGIAAGDLKGMSPDEQFRKIAEQIAKIPDAGDRAAATMKVFGRSGTALIPMIENLGNLESTAKKFGMVKSTESAKAWKEMSMLWQLGEMALKGVWGTLSGAVMPVLKEQTQMIIRGTMVVRDFIKQHKDVVTIAFKVGSALAIAGTAFMVAGKAVGIFASSLGMVSTAMKFTTGIFGTLASIAGGVFSVAFGSGIGIAITALAAFGAYLLYTSDIGQKVVQALGAYFADLKDTVMSIFGGIKDALTAGDWSLAASIAGTGIHLAFVQAIQPLRNLWINIKAEALKIWDEIGLAIQKAMIGAVTVAMKAMVIFRQYQRSLLEGFNKGFDSGATSMLDPKGAMDALVNPKINTTLNPEDKKADDEAADALAKINAAAGEYNRAAEGGTQSPDVRDQDAADETKALADQMKRLQVELKLLTAQAKTEASAKRHDFDHLLPDKPGGAAEGVEALSQKASARAIFNPAAIQGLQGGRDVQSKIADSTAKTAVAVTAIQQKLADYKFNTNGLFN